MYLFQNESHEMAKCDDVTSSELEMISTEDKKIEDPLTANNITATTLSGQERKTLPLMTSNLKTNMKHYLVIQK